MIGSAQGVFRVYDVTNRKSPRLVNCMKFYSENEPISDIVCSPDGNIVIISSAESNKVWFMSQQASQQF